jgi:ribosomal-protein-alanine N-acetyltransferase
MDDEYIIDEMTEDDLKEVTEIEASSFPEPWSRDLFLRELEHKYSHNLVARWLDGESKRVVGYVVFWDVTDEIHLLDLAVHADFRRKGIAKAFLKGVVEAGLQMGCDRIFLDVRESNKEALRLYSLFGFKEIGLRERYYKDGENAIVMSTKLTSSLLV